MNPVLFDPNTPQQRSEAFIQDLLYYPEIENSRSMHNQLTNPEAFVPPPKVMSDTTRFYPTSSGFFSNDPLAAYKSLGQQTEKPYHLMEYDLRFTEPNNYFTRGNPLYTKNESI